MATGDITLLDAVKSMKDSPEKGVIMTYATEYQPFMVLPLETIQSGVKTWQVYDSLMTDTSSEIYRIYNAEFTARKTSPLNRSQNVVVAGGRIQVDRAVNQINPAYNIDQQKVQIQTLAYHTTKEFFTGTTSYGIKGLDYYITYDSLFSAQSSDVGTASTSALLDGDDLEKLLSLVNAQPGRTFIYATDTVTRRIRKLARGSLSNEYNVQYTPEMLGTFAGKWDNVPVITLKDGKGNDLLPKTLGAGDASCVYAVTYGDDNLKGFQVAPMAVYGMNQISVMQGYDIEWQMNIAPLNRRCFARLNYVKEAVA